MSQLSRQELLAWVNDLLQLNVTKVEELGRGAALCQIYDSIYGDLPMSQVKFNAKTYPEYFNNLKILQKAFNRHKIDDIPLQIDVLAKLKFQDNLAFLQKTKEHWDKHYSGSYDPIARRQGSGEIGGGGGGGSGGGGAISAGAVRRAPAASASSGTRTGSAAAGRVAAGGAAVAQLKQENALLKENITGLERERDFYFGKLRDIELLIQQAVELDPEIEKDEDGLIKTIQNVLYSTEDGFEIPAEGEAAETLDDQETF